MVVIASKPGGRNQHCRKALRNHTAPITLANTGRSKIIPQKIGSGFVHPRRAGGQMYKGQSHDTGGWVGGWVACWTPSWILKNQGRN